MHTTLLMIKESEKRLKEDIILLLLFLMLFSMSKEKILTFCFLAVKMFDVLKGMILKNKIKEKKKSIFNKIKTNKEWLEFEFVLEKEIYLKTNNFQKIKITKKENTLTLKNPIKFYSMENPDEKISIDMIFMLALSSSTEHLDVLKKLFIAFQNQELVSQLKVCQNKEIFLKLLADNLN